MALTQLGSPYPVFTDLDGTPLDGGFVYIGVADDNPETAPILVYYDQELTQIAPQPLRTVNGYVMRNGAPAILYADATFSVTVRNRNGALVLYAGQSFGFLPGGGLRSQNNLSDVDSAATSLQNLGLTATAAELNFSDGVTSNIQTQLDGKLESSDLVNLTEAQVQDEASTDFGQVSGQRLAQAINISDAWTPALQDAAGNLPDTVSVATGDYVKVGKLLFYDFRIVVNKGTQSSTTQLRILGLPGSASSSNRVNSFTPMNYFNFTPTEAPMLKSASDASGNPAILLLQSSNDAVSNYYTFATLPSGSITISGSGFLEVD